MTRSKRLSALHSTRMAIVRRLLLVSTLALAAAACGTTDYAYVPAGAPTAEVSGRVAADYPIPATAPKGRLRVMSYGVVQAASQDGVTQLPALHVRLVVKNDSARPWTLDTREQQAELGARPAQAPAFASAGPGGSAPPVVTIAAGTSRPIDVFFPVPTDLAEDEAPSFVLRWRLNTGEAIYVGTTQFERVEVDENDQYVASPYDYGPGYYWGPPYWYNPMYPYWGFGVGVVVVGPRFYGRHWYGGGYYGHYGYVPRAGRPPVIAHPHGGGFHGGGFHGGGHHR